MVHSNAMELTESQIPPAGGCQPRPVLRLPGGNRLARLTHDSWRSMLSQDTMLKPL